MGRVGGRLIIEQFMTGEIEGRFLRHCYTVYELDVLVNTATCMVVAGNEEAGAFLPTSDSVDERGV